MDATINGARIHYERSGKGFPVVLLHAGVADSRMWASQVAAFEKHFDVVRPDMRGYGKSELPPAPWSQAADVIALMDHLRLARAHVVGCSIGGAAAIDVAIEHPSRVDRLVLVGPGVGGLDFGDKYDEFFAEVDAAEKSGDLAALNEAEMHLWLDGPSRPHGYVEQPLRDLFLEMNGIGLRSDFGKAPRHRLDPPAADRLSDLNAPALVIVGDQDVPESLETADLLLKRSPHARKAVIKDAAHLPNLEHPDEFNRLVLDFLLS